MRIASGTYSGGVYLEGLAGSAEQPIIIEGADPKRPPVFDGGGEAIHLTDPRHVTLRHLVIRGQSGNGINIDGGGSYDSPAHHITVEHVAFVAEVNAALCDKTKWTKAPKLNQRLEMPSRTLLRKLVVVGISSAFVADLQTWAEQNCVRFRPTRAMWEEMKRKP